MKWRSIIVLLALAVSILAPATFSSLAAHHGQTALSALDVCHSSVPAVSAEGEMPCLAVHSQLPSHMPFIASFIEFEPRFTALLLINSNERPPAV